MIALKPITLQLLDSFQYFDWFSNIGKPIHKDVIQPSSLDEAYHYMESHEWGEAWIESGNQFSHCVRKQFGESELFDMEAKVSALYELYADFKLPHHHIALSKRVQTSLKQTYITLGIEIEYVDSCFPPLSEKMTKMYQEYKEKGYFYRVPQVFAGEIAYWYMIGHLPCGWVGEYPDGKLVVY